MTSKKHNKWPAPPTDVVYLKPTGLSKETRKFLSVSFEEAPYQARRILDDAAGDSVWLALTFNPGSSGVVDIEVVPFDPRRMIESGDEAKHLPLYIEELSKRVEAGSRSCPQYMQIHVDGWFSIESDTKDAPALVPPGLEGGTVYVH